MRLTRLLLLLTLLSAGCATARTPPPSPADVPALEARLGREPGSVPVRLRLGAAYREAGQPERAATVLEPVVAADSGEAHASLQLGLAYEDLGRYADARRLYENFLRRTRSGSMRRTMEDRLEVLARLELREAVRNAIRQEEQLARRAPTPRTVGVFPFLFVGSDTTLRPLGRAFADLLTTDLSVTNRLTVLERVQLQYLVEEIELGRSQYVDASTAARAGRILSAANIVQGRIDGGSNEVGVQALVVTTAQPRDTTAMPLREQGGLSRLFDIEKNLALAVYSRLGIQLTAAERQRVNQRPTQNIQALLAFGYGLEARDAGRYEEAASHFQRAIELDPGFRRAAELDLEARRLLEVAGVSTQDVGRQAATRLGFDLTEFQRERMGLDALETMLPLPQIRDPVVEIAGTEGLDRGAGIDIIIRRPGTFR